LNYGGDVEEYITDFEKRAYFVIVFHMAPEEKDLLERTLKLSEENHKILLDLRSRARWSTLWGLIKLLLIVGPLILGYVYLEPYLGSFKDTLGNAQDIFQTLK